MREVKIKRHGAVDADSNCDLCAAWHSPVSCSNAKVVSYSTGIDAAGAKTKFEKRLVWASAEG